jgi:hypothetical protein
MAAGNGVAQHLNNAGPDGCDQAQEDWYGLAPVQHDIDILATHAGQALSG